MEKNEKIRKNKFKVKILSGIVTICIGTSLIICPEFNTVYAQNTNNIKIYMNNNLIKTNNTPFIISGRTYVPLRVISENLGASVKWDNENRKVIITKGSSSITMYIDNRLYSHTENGITKYGVSDVAPLIKNGYTYVPLRLIGNALGLDAEWNGTKREVILRNSSDTIVEDFYKIKINGIDNGQIIKSKTNFSLINTSTLPSNASQVRYLFLNPKTGMGKIIAMSNDINSSVEFIPDISMKGNGVIAAVVCDKNGDFLAGTCIEATINVEPSLSFSGIKSGQSVDSTASLQAILNFRPESIQYEFEYSNGKIYLEKNLDPYGTFNYTPSISKNGAFSVRLIAVDHNGVKYYSEKVNATINMQPTPVTPYVTLKRFNISNVGKIPVNLSISRNFDVDTTQYYAKNIKTGKSILLKEVGWGDYSWFPGPDMAGEWEIYVRVVNSKDKKAYYSNSIKVTVANTPSITLSGVGPDQFVTSSMTLSSYSNVDINEVSYVISNPYNYTEKVMGTKNTTSEKVTYTPNYVNEGYRYIQAIATTTDGKTLKSDKVKVKIYLGEIYKSRAITDKDKFIDFVAPLAMKVQKENGMSAAIQIAQAILESGWGQSIPVDKYTGQFSCNLFGIKGTGNAGSIIILTSEVYNGTKYYIEDYFRAYKGVQDSIDDHSNLLTQVNRYIPYKNIMFNSTAGAYALKRCGYATDPNYSGKLIFMIEKYGLDKYDQQKI